MAFHIHVTVTLTSDILPIACMYILGEEFATPLGRIQVTNEKLWPEHISWLTVHCDLEIRDMTLGQGHDTPPGH